MRRGAGSLGSGQGSEARDEEEKGREFAESIDWKLIVNNRHIDGFLCCFC